MQLCSLRLLRKDLHLSKLDSLCVYCGSQAGSNPQYLEAAETLGTAMAQARIRLVYGGGLHGIMGAVAKSVLAGGGEVTGIIPQFLITKESSEEGLATLTEVIVTQDMHERKHAMFERSDGFVTLPGGIGTLEEVIEILTWAQLGRHEKPICLANIAGFWDPLLALIGHMRESGFIHTANRIRPIVAQRAADIVPLMMDAAGGAEAFAGDEAAISRM